MSRGPVWGAASDDLNATMLAWPAGEGPAEHVNAERDVLYVIVEGGGRLTVDGEPREVRAGDALIVGKGSARALVAGAGGIRYVTAHLRRGALQIKRSV